MNETPQHIAANNDPAPLFEFTGTGKSLFFMHLVNGLFIALTMGIYSFWATTKIRKYFWSNTLVQGEPLEYTGTGRQLALGFVVGILILVLISALIVPMDLIFGPPASAVTGAVIFFVFMPYAMYRSLRYRLAHTRLHSIPFGLDGSPMKFAGRTILRSLIAILSLGLMGPWAYAKITQDIMSNIRYGDKPFTFTGSTMKLVKASILPYLMMYAPVVAYLVFLAALLTIPGLLGMVAGNEAVIILSIIAIFVTATAGTLIWRCRMLHWMAEGTSFGNASFTCSIKPAALLWAIVKFVLLTVLTFGIGFAWASVGLQKFFAKQFGLSGDLNFAEVHRGAHQQETTGDGIAQAFDFDLAV
ncbi:YjgN family protein [Oleidesulfovibrio sp.]|uniref:YjgN family protein n=1 Tax=Oleidesulfovibrio sp. TaxID=2909707 RepID=UPI003A85FF2D